MNTDNDYYYLDEEEDDEVAIDWAALFTKLWAGRKTIIISSIIAGVLGVLVALGSTKKYTSSVVLAPELSTGGSMSGGLKSITSMLGMGSILGGGSSGDALNITLFPDIASSTPFLTGLFDVEFVPYITPKEALNGVESKPAVTLYDHLLGKDKEPGFVKQMMESMFGPSEENPLNTMRTDSCQLTFEEDMALKVLSKMISVDVDKKTGVTTISVTAKDQRLCALLADTVASRLQRIVHEYRTHKAGIDVKYYTELAEEARQKMIEAQRKYGVSVDYDRSVILQTVSSEKTRLQDEASIAQQIYQQLVQQREAAMIKYQELKPVFVVIQPAVLPNKPSSVRRLFIVVGFGFVGFMFSVAWVMFLRDIKKKVMDMIKDAKNPKDAEAVEVAEAPAE